MPPRLMRRATLKCHRGGFLLICQGQRVILQPPKVLSIRLLKRVTERPEPFGVRSDALKDLLEQAAISEAHSTLMSMVVQRISFAGSGLHEAFMSVLKGFEVHEMLYVFDGTAHVRCAL